MEGDNAFEYNISDTLYATVVEKMESIWKEIPKHTSFSTTLPEGSQGRAATSPTDPHRKLDGPDLRSNGKRGHVTEVRIDPKITSGLKQLLDNPPQNKRLVLYAQLDFAITMCHEVVHVIDYARRDMAINGARIYFDGECYEEVGLAWTQYVLGGLMFPDIENPKKRLEAARFLHHWPSFGNWEEGKRGSPKVTRENHHPSAYGMEWLLDFTHVEKLHQQSFWDEVNETAKEGDHTKVRDMVRFPKHIGRLVAKEPAKVYDASNMKSLLESVAGLDLHTWEYKRGANDIMRRKGRKE